MARVGKIIMWILLGFAFVVVITFITQHLWNWLVPVIFKGPAITFWQTLGLLLLSKIIFSGFGRKHHHYKNPQHSWKEKFYGKFSNMSPEDKETFKNKMKEKWCSDFSRSSEEKPASND
jgi:hypothetical protein